MIQRILVAVDDSAPALAAVRFAIRIAQQLSAELRIATVTTAHHDRSAILRHASAMATEAGLATTVTEVHNGAMAFEALLQEVNRWNADVVVMGRSDKRPTGRPYVGSQTEHLLEFTDVPVVVVPDVDRR